MYLKICLSRIRRTCGGTNSIGFPDISIFHKRPFVANLVIEGGKLDKRLSHIYKFTKLPNFPISGDNIHIRLFEICNVDKFTKSQNDSGKVRILLSLQSRLRNNFKLPIICGNVLIRL